ncbi:hypothetical protein QYE76_030652 [Lolium multiflorum]|uniref:Integrase zinc-binding domain-containing protein n=1 Tax=Lolium multiflorum TaxID=4521 RepID=A0AAD8VHS0_LOLMU|nr:hypothetical protein QYE76_030652 [Lolium multiflorum]
MLVDSMDIDVPVFVVREAPSWVKPIKEFLINGTLPVDENESRRIQRRAKAYTFINGEVYKRSVTGVLQRCVEPEEGKEMLKEIHQGECGHHASSRALVAKVFRHGFYWPTALENAEDLVRKCNGCQRYAKQNHTPASGLKTIPLTWPFAVWCLDMVGPFKTARGNMTHILVMVDKFTKWLEVKPIAKCDGHTTSKSAVVPRRTRTRTVLAGPARKSARLQGPASAVSAMEKAQHRTASKNLDPAGTFTPLAHLPDDHLSSVARDSGLSFMTEKHTEAEILSLVRAKEAAQALLAQAALRKEASLVDAGALSLPSAPGVVGTTPVSGEEGQETLVDVPVQAAPQANKRSAPALLASRRGRRKATLS